MPPSPKVSDAEAEERHEETTQNLRQALYKPSSPVFQFGAAGARGLTAIGTAARYIVLVRLLKPFDFGVIASASLVCTALSAMTEPRWDWRSSQQEDQIDPYLDTLFTTYLVRSLIIGLILIGFRGHWQFFSPGAPRTQVCWAISRCRSCNRTQSPRLVSLYRHLISIS